MFPWKSDDTSLCITEVQKSLSTIQYWQQRHGNVTLYFLCCWATHVAVKTWHLLIPSSQVPGIFLRSEPISTNFCKSPPVTNFTKIGPVAAEHVHAVRRTGGQKDSIRRTSALGDYAKAPEEGWKNICEFTVYAY